MLESPAAAIAVFAAATLVIIFAGGRMSRLADRLADRTGLGEAFVGSLVLAGATSLPDLAATLGAALRERPSLAMSNVMGSMAANLAFLGVADLIYRKANLEHATASLGILVQAVLLISLLTIAIAGMLVPAPTILGMHPVTPLIVVTYLFGLRLLRRARERPMWLPRRTAYTVQDVPTATGQGGSLVTLWSAFAVATIITAASGWVMLEAALVLVDRGGLSESVAGGLVTALGTSAPELVTTIAAVRQGALTLAVGNIVGTNCFNTLIIAAADVAYRGGSIFRDVSSAEIVWGLAAILMTAVLLLGLLLRQTFGFARVGTETLLMIAVYAITVVIAIGGFA